MLTKTVMIQDCKIEPERLLVISECTETYGMEEQDPENEWVWNVISRRSVVYSCGIICREGELVEHNHSFGEIALCKRLSQEAATIMSGQFIDMADESEHELVPFYVVANEEVDVPDCVTEELIRSAFGGTIYPYADVLIESLEKEEEWWKKAIKDYDYDDDIEYNDQRVSSWFKLISWFKCQPDLHSPVFVSIDINSWKNVDRKGVNLYNGGCVYPRLAVAITKSGSLVGLFSCVVHT
jgi:hypothetical protein